jgi:hypothetical protein
MISRFDDVAKGLAGGVSRREAMHRLGGQFLQRHHPARTGRLMENHT